jgi:hypothetical protein
VDFKWTGDTLTRRHAVQAAAGGGGVPLTETAVQGIISLYDQVGAPTSTARPALHGCAVLRYTAVHAVLPIRHRTPATALLPMRHGRRWFGATQPTSVRLVISRKWTRDYSKWTGG